MINKRDLVNRIKANFPKELLGLDQWVCWRIEVRDDKPTKVPYSVNGYRAASDKPTTWASFETACKAYLNGNYNGVGFMFSEHDPYVGIDFDKCIDDSGNVDPAKWDLIYGLGSYTERSQSGTGVHIIAKGTLPPGGRKSSKQQIEIYDRLRFFVVTGDVLPDYHPSVEDRQAEIEHFHKTIFPAKEQTAQTAYTNGNGQIPTNDQALLDRMFASRNGADIQALWLGNKSAYNGDESAADLALCNHLAFWTGNDADRMDRLFRQSRLYRAHKWDRNARTGEKYGEGTISRAIAATQETYSPRRQETNEIRIIESVTPTIQLNGNGSHNHAEQAADSGYAKPEAPESPTDDESEKTLLREGAHDEGNAQCVHLRHNGKFLHSESLGWLAHTGTHWTMAEAEALVERAITDTLIARLNVAVKAELSEDRIKKFIPNSGRVQGAKSQLRSLVSVVPERFDTEPNYLNCRNGVVDLRTSELFGHSPNQRFMHCTAVDYLPSADYSLWSNWLIDAVGSPMADWLQIAVGYSITGHTREEVLFYLYGPPRSGKGTFTETLLNLLGVPLAKEVSFSMFLAQRTGDSQNFDLAPLKPTRFLAASESNSYERFNEAKIKALTGGNEVYCAFKHRDHFNYRPQFKIWLSSNQPINADPDDEAVWGRLRVVEFPHSHLGNEDKSLKHAMRTPEALQGVLAWAVAGAMRWYKLGNAGLPEIESSAATKKTHRSELDNVQAWLDECCSLVDTFCAYSALYNSYELWCKANGVEPKKQKGFSQAMIHKGFSSKTARSGNTTVRGFQGLRLL